jgi:ankyrin repeat protein
MEQRQSVVVENLTNNLCCPISGAIFVDPVMAADGNTYEREMIEKWFIWNNKSPLTNEVISKILIPNITIKKFVGDFLELEKINSGFNKINICSGNDEIKTDKIKTNKILQSERKPKIDNNFIISKTSLDVTDRQLKSIIAKYGFDYVDKNGTHILDFILRTTKSSDIISHIINEHVRLNILEKQYELSNVEVQKLIHMICRYCDEKHIRKIIMEGCDIEAEDTYQNRPIHYVCVFGSLYSVMYLVKRKVNLNICNSNGQLPLHLICQFGDLPSIKCVVLQTANINVVTYNGDSYKNYLKYNKRLYPQDIQELDKFIKENYK